MEQQRNRLTRNNKLLFGALFVCAMFGIDLGMRHIAVVTSPSLPYRVFFLGKPAPKKDGFVYFFLKDRFANNYITKMVTCTPGEELIVRGRDYYCGLRPLGTAKEFSQKGEKIDQFLFLGNIPKGKYFVSGTHKDSYDSRYFGFIDEKDIEASAYPIF